MSRTEPARFVLLTLLATNAAVPDPVLQRYRGRLIERSDEVSVVAFDGPTRALHCAQAIQGQLPGVKIGLHAGECMVQNGDISGAVVRIALQLMAKAASDSIMVSNMVKDLVASTNFDFEAGDTIQSWQTFTIV
ncbi:MAG: hypothetical protein L0154_18575 [Chloroflexi bacterium]|nr:hypothetical protein [Chloroflexota bacterium]